MKHLKILLKIKFKLPFLIVNGSIPVWRPESITRAPVLKAALAIPA